MDRMEFPKLMITRFLTHQGDWLALLKQSFKIAKLPFLFITIFYILNFMGK